MSKYSTAYQFCPNRNCQHHRQLREGNVNVHDSKKNRFICKECRKTWVGHRGERRYGLRTELTKIERALDLLQAGWSIRKTAELAQVSPSTVLRWKQTLQRSSSY